MLRLRSQCLIKNEMSGAESVFGKVQKNTSYIEVSSQKIRFKLWLNAQIHYFFSSATFEN